MPLMVEDHSMMDAMDDLFGDDDNDGLNAAIAATLDSDVLRQRIEQTHAVGCCQKLAWSKTGSVAHIAQDGRTITVQALVRDNKSGRWSLSNGTSKPIIAQDNARFTHLDWSSSGNDLVVTDQNGRLYVYVMAFALNRLMPNPLQYTVPQDDLSAVVGLHWLPMNMGPSPRFPIISPASKDGDRWHSNMHLQQSHAVTHPFDNKSAFLCATRNNLLKLISQQPNQPWSEATLELGDPTSSGDIITHAAFGDAPNHIVMATFDTSKCLRLYRVNILWNMAQGDPQHGVTPSVTPVLRVTHVQLLDRVQPQTPNGSALSHLKIEPPMFWADKGRVTITAVFTCLPDEQEIGHETGDRGSIIARWELRRSEALLHDVFKTLKPGAEKPAASKPRDILFRYPDVFTPKIVLSLTSNLYHNILGFAASDGTVEFRQRDTLDMIISDETSSRISALPQVGFTFLSTECAEIALSPSASVAAIAKSDGSVHLHIAEFVHGWTGAKAEDYLPQAAMVALAREAAILMYHGLGTDDILSLIPLDADKGLRQKFLAETIRSVGRTTDYTTEEATKDKMRIVKDNLLYKILSMQSVLGYKDNNPARRDIPGKFAWVMLNLKSISQNVAACVAGNAMQASPELMISLSGLAKWLLDLMTLILDDLVQMKRLLQSSKPPQTPSKSAIEALLERLNTPALHLVLQSASRALLKLLVEVIIAYFKRSITSKTSPLLSSVAQRSALNEIEALVQSRVGFKLPVFELLLNEIDGMIRKAYTEMRLDAKAKDITEQGMLVSADIPDVFARPGGVLESLFGTLLPRMSNSDKGGLDEPKLFLADTTWLGIKDEQAKPRNGKERKIDIVRKAEISPIGRDGQAVKTRSCRRCGSLVEDVWEGLPMWLSHGHRSCVCTSQWVI